MISEEALINSFFLPVQRDRIVNILVVREPVKIVKGHAGLWLVRARADDFAIHPTDTKKEAIAFCKKFGLPYCSEVVPS